MPWGDALSNAWDSATETAKQAAAAVATGADYAREKAVAAASAAKEAAVWAGEKGRQAAAWAEQKARQAAAYAEKKAREAAAWADERARRAVRDRLRKIADGGFDKASAAAEKLRRLKQRAGEAYDAVKQVFSDKPHAKPVQTCPGTSDDGTKDADRDGWIMIPQGPGKPCVSVPPGKGVNQARERAVVSASPCCAAKRGKAPPRDIIYVNGINTTAAAHCETLNRIALQSCGRVIGLYNATEGFAADAAQTGQDRRLIKQAAGGKPAPSGDKRNPAVDELSKLIDRELTAGRKPEIWAHSQGAAVTSLALYDAQNRQLISSGDPDPMKGVKVKSFGGAAPKWVDGPEYQHFVHVNDPVPTTLGMGHSGNEDAANAGKGAKVVRFGGDPKGTAPLDAAKPKLDYIPKDLGNHDMNSGYLKMEKQENGGC